MSPNDHKNTNSRAERDDDENSQSILIRNTGLKVTDILDLIAQGYSYYQILLNHPQINLSDIMVSARVAEQLIQELVTVQGTVMIEANLEVTCHNGRLIDLTSMRRQFPRAFEPWTRQEEEDLAGQYHQGLSAAEIAALHGRKRGAIRTRLKKLGLIERRSDNRRD
jgi:uncharacterized protein (DUF433 family)